MIHCNTAMKIKRRLISQYSIHNTSLNTSFGFTLIELIIVMAVLGGLAGLIVIQLPAGTERARDSARKSDLSQYRTSLESFANRKNGFYPGFSSGLDPSDVTAGVDNDLCDDALGFSTGECPSDPRDGQSVCEDGSGGDADCEYTYQSNGSVNTGAAVATQYVLFGRQERPTDNSREFWVTCSTGRAGYTDAAPSGGSCPANLTD